MRILVDVRHLSSDKPAGVGTYTISLLNTLFTIDQENSYVLLSSGKQRPHLSDLFLESSAYEHVHVSIPNKLLNLRTWLQKKPSIDSYICGPIDLIFLPNLNITALPLEIPTVLMVHDLSWYLYPECYSRKMQLWHKAVRPQELMAQARSIITPSESTKQDLEHVFGSTTGRTHVIPHGVASTFSPHLQAADHGVRSRLKLPRRFVLFVGTIEPRKNLLALIDGIEEYRLQSHDDLHLVLAGNWGWKSGDIRRRLWNKDVSSWVHQMGYIKTQELPALYRSAQALVFPSLYEGFGMPLLEAMASGTPIITSHTSSMPEVGGASAIYIDPYNSRDICDALRGLLGSSSLHKQLRDQGLERAGTFTWEKTAERTIEVFKSSKEGC